MTLKVCREALLCGVIMVWLLPACGSGLQFLNESVSGAQVSVVPEGEVSFGAVSPAGRTAFEEVQITATGDEAVTLESVTLESQGNDCFTLDYDPAPVHLDRGETTQARVGFLPDATGTFRGTLKLTFTMNGGVEMVRQMVGTGCDDPRQTGECSEGGNDGWDTADTGF